MKKGLYDLLYKKYSLMMKDILGNDLMNQKAFSEYMQTELKGMSFFESREKGQISFLYYGAWEENGVNHYYVPTFGYYAEDEKSMVRLFQKWSGEIVDGVCEFSVNLYAKDNDCIRGFHMMQFGNMSEKCIKELEDNYSALEGFDIKVLYKEDIKSNWSEIWRATGSIIEHLKRAPVFYPADEFTEEIYNEFFMSEDLELIAAYKDNKIAGIIEWNKDENEFMHKKDDSVNVGEAFVYPEYRGTGLSEKLLRFSEKRALAKGYKYMWVEHGTANPNARGFWNKYFKTYSYELVRTIMR